MILKKILKCLSIMVLIGLISVFALGCSNEEAPGTSDQDNEEKPTYIVAFEATFPPFESKDEETGEFIGFDIDLIRAIGEVEGFDVELMEMGFDGVDLGVDVETDKFIASVKEHNPQIVGMSALLTTTMPAMKDVIAVLQEGDLRNGVKVIIGGAPVTNDYANEIGADGYAADAAIAIDLCKELVG
jgi:hypothetical protein